MLTFRRMPRHHGLFKGADKLGKSNDCSAAAKLGRCAHEYCTHWPQSDLVRKQRRGSGRHSVVVPAAGSTAESGATGACGALFDSLYRGRAAFPDIDEAPFIYQEPRRRILAKDVPNCQNKLGGEKLVPGARGGASPGTARLLAKGLCWIRSFVVAKYSCCHRLLRHHMHFFASLFSPAPPQPLPRRSDPRGAQCEHSPK